MLHMHNNPAGWRDWYNSQENHRNKIKKIYASTSARLDNHLSSVYKMPQSSKLPTASIYGSSLNLREIDRKNAKILDKLTKMARSPVILKTLPVAENRVNKRKYFLKKLENVKIHQENIMLAKRLAKTSSSVNFKKYEAEFENNKKYCIIRKKFK